MRLQCETSLSVPRGQRMTQAPAPVAVQDVAEVEEPGERGGPAGA